MNITTLRARAARWAKHDSRIPFRDERAVFLNGTNRAGRRPHILVEPQLRPANDNKGRSDAA